MVTVECVILGVCPPYLETSQFIRSLLRRHISSVCASFPSYCSVMTSRCASRGPVVPLRCVLLLARIKGEAYTLHENHYETLPQTKPAHNNSVPAFARP